jgi:hypothetical protein
MHRGTSFWSFLLSGAALLTAAGACHADSITAEFNSVTDGGVLVTLGLDNGSGDKLSVSGYAGEYNWKQLSGSPTLGNAGSFSTFCIEISQDINFGGKYGYNLVAPSTAPQPSSFWTPAGGMGAADATLIAELWNAHYVSDPNNWSVDGEASFQFAIWDIIYGKELTISGYGPANDGAKVSNDATTAMDWVNALPTDGSGAQANLIALTSNGTTNPNPNSQDQITGSPYSPPTPTAAPLPGTAKMGLILLSAFGAVVALGRRVSPRAAQ